MDIGAAMYAYDAPADEICLRKYAEPRISRELVSPKRRQSAGAAGAGCGSGWRGAGLGRTDPRLQHGDVLLQLRLEPIQRVGELIILQGLRVIAGLLL